MELFLQVRRNKTTLFLDAKGTATIFKLKQMIEGILKIPPENQVLYDSTNSQKLDDEKSLIDCGFTQQNAKAQDPAQLNLAVIVDGVLEPVHIDDYSTPPELPDVMKPHDGASAS
uniref:Transcription elongation factor B polypeptide 2-like n=1 Tax=Phallusia mammillata TaxID=59560 RepID=A0A6F9DV63_9ASCI|nr:transcription elongation factor B polypeptide 2-like [Phallusia mammillata]